MKKFIITLAGVACLLLVVAFWLLNTGAGLRWAVARVTAMADVPVEVGTVEGRLLGPVSLSDVKYAEPEDGIVVRIGDLRLDWKPVALLGGLLHVTSLEASGVEYAKKGSSPSTAEDAFVFPELTVPVELQLDRLQVKSISIRTDGGEPALIDLVSFQGSADQESIALSDLIVEAAAYRVGEGRARLGLERDLPLEGSLNWTVQPEGVDRFEGTLTVGGGLAATLKPAIEINQPFAARGEGTASALFSEPAWTLGLTVPRPVSLETIKAGWPAVSVSGSMSSDGDTGRASLRPELSLSFQGNEVLLTGEAALSAERLDVARARLERVGEPGVVDFSGALEFEARTWTLEASVPEAVSLETIDAGWPAVSVSGSVSSNGDATLAELRPELSLQFKDQEALLTGEATISAARLDVAGARLVRPGAPDAVDFSGWLGFENALPFSVTGEWQSLHGPEAAAWSSRQGEFEAAGDRNSFEASLSGVVTPPGEGDESPVSLGVNADGLRKDPVVTGNARLPYFAYGGAAAEDLNADIDFRAAEGASSEISVTAATVRYGERRVENLELRASGTPARHEASLTGRLDERSIDAGISGSYSSERWEGQLDRFTIVGEPPVGTWRMAQPAEVKWTPALAAIEGFCLRRETVSACVEGRLKEGGDWDAAAELAELPLSWLAANAPDPLRVEGAVSARARLASSAAGIEGDAEAAIDQALVAWTAEDPVETRYRDIELTADLNPDTLELALSGRVDESGVLQGDLTLRQPFAEDGRVQGSIAAQLPSLRVLQAAAPALGLKSGNANLQLNVSGTRRAPRFGGEARIQQATLEIPALGVELHELGLDVRGGDDRRLELDARARSGEGELSADGFVAWPVEGGWNGEFEVNGDNVELVRLPQALVFGNPDMDISLSPGGGRVDGRIDVTRAELTPEAARPRITISEDIVVLDEEAPRQVARNPMGWHVNMAVDLGNEVRFEGYGLEGRLAGSLALDAPPRQPTRATGSVEIREGRYELYGTKFDIQRGRLVYTGGPIDNPGIDVQVGREVRDVSVTLAATGPLTDPDLSMTSTPAMSDTDKMSYLLLGRPSSEASGAELGVLVRAAASLIPGGGSGVQGRIQSTLGLDTLELRADSPNGEGASVELGKYLSPRLYVSYVSGFQQAVDVFRVHYDLARHWLLRAESSSRESSGDLLLTW